MATRNRYAEIMAQYAQSQPFSFFGYPQAYTGGYDVAQPQASVPVTRYEEIMAQPAMGGGGRITQADEGPTWSEPTSEQAYNWSQAGKNLTFISPLLGGLAGWYGNYLARNVDPNYSHEGRNYAAPTGGFVAVTPQQAAAEAAAAQAVAAAQAEAARQPIVESPGGMGGGYSQRGGESVGGYSGAAASRAASGQFGMGPGTAGFNSGGRSGDGGGGVATGGNNGDASGGGDFAQGGYVSMMHLGGPDPEGSDDGYAALKDGEFVINDKAVKKYGIELMQAINSGKISKGKLRGLLEM